MRDRCVFCTKCRNFIIIKRDEKVTVTCVAFCEWVCDPFRERVFVKSFSFPELLNGDNKCGAYAWKILSSRKASEFKKWILEQLDAVEGNESDLESIDMGSRYYSEEEDDSQEETPEREQEEFATEELDEDREKETLQPDRGFEDQD